MAPSGVVTGSMFVLVLLRAAMTVAAIALVFRFARSRTGRKAGRGSWASVVLVNLVVASIVLFFDATVWPRPGAALNVHDIFHYYMGAKYAPEVGYWSLYPCTIVADTDNRGGQLRLARFRRMEDYRFAPARGVLEAAGRWRDLFTTARWQAFREDVAAFHDWTGDEGFWSEVVLDNGYNATPVWNMVAGVLARSVPAHPAWGLPFLASLDAALLAGAFVLLGRAFGRRTALLSLVFLGTQFFVATGHIRGAFLRLDWICLLVVAVGLLRLGHYRTAGACVAYAALVRVFPVLFVFGLGAKWISDFDRRRSGFFAGFGLTLAALFALSVVHDGGLDHWREFREKITVHDSALQSTRVGFKHVFATAVGGSLESWNSRSPVQRAAWWAIQAAVVAGCFLAARRLEDWETLALGWVLAYFLTAPTFYYHVMLVVPALPFLAKLGERGRAAGAALLLSVSTVGYLAYALTAGSSTATALRWPQPQPFVTLVLSSLLLVASLYILGDVFLTPVLGTPLATGLGPLPCGPRRRRAGRRGA